MQVRFLSATPRYWRYLQKKVGKRKSKSWRKRRPVCTLCTTHRWLGNKRSRFSHTYYKQAAKNT